MANPQTVSDWDAFDAYQRKLIDKTDIIVLIFLSHSQSGAIHVSISQPDIGKACLLRKQHVNRSLRKLQKAGLLNISKIPGERTLAYEVPAVTLRNTRRENLAERGRAQAAQLRDIQDKLAASRRAEITVLKPAKSSI